MSWRRDVSIPATGDYVLGSARIPECVLATAVPDAPSDGDRMCLADIAVAGGRIAEIAPPGTISGERPLVALGGRVVWPTLVDMHTHLDKGQAIPRAQPDGTIVGGSNATAADRLHWSAKDVARRMSFGLRCAYVHGVSAIRTHIDSNHELTELSWSVFRELRSGWRGRIALQGVGLVPLDFFLGADGERLADLVAESGGILGGVTDGIGDDWGNTSALDTSLDRFLALAQARDLDVDLHVDQTADIAAFALPSVARAVIRSRFAGRVVVGHCVNLALQPDDVVARTLELCAEARLAFVTLPTPMMYLMDRAAGRTPRWRGVTAVNEIRAAGLPIAIGGDNCRDAWYAYGDHDMVDTFQQAVRTLHLDHPFADAPAMASSIPARIIDEPAHGRIAVGGPADLILFAARTLNELMCRPQADRIVIRAGREVTEPLPDYAELDG